MRLKYPLLVICFTLACGAAASAQTIQSVYTNFKNCKTVDREDDAAGYLLERCPGVGGYSLLVRSQDDRQDITVVAPDGSEQELRLYQIGSGGFSHLGPNVEWRVKTSRGKQVPVALIVRYNVADPSSVGKYVSHLAVSKITPRQVCRVGTVPPGRNANVESRRMADGSADTSCSSDPVE